MLAGLTPQQEIVEVRVQHAVGTSLKASIDAALADRPLHQIVSLSVTSTQEFNTSAVVLLVIEYLETGE